MAILYKANETDFSHLGLGPLNDAVSILVTEERNGIFELEMKYPVSGKLFSELKNDRLIKADAGHKLKDQRFKIIRITKPLDGIVTVYAEHVSYLTQDLALKPKVTFSGNARQALEHWKANLVDDNPFTVWSDISTTGKINWSIDEVENARRALGGVQGSILDVYGGEYLFDNYDIRLLEKRGVKSEALIAYGRNLVDLEQDEEIANTYTSIYPYSIYTDDDGNERMVTLPEYYVDSPYVNNYARRKILAVDFSDEEIKTVSALRSAANRYIADNDVGVPRVNLKIKFLDLAKTLDYKHQALLEEVNLCDEVTVYFEEFDINTTAKVIKVVWDALQDRYDSIEVGEARSSLSQAIDTVVDGKVEKTERLSMQAIRTADGKNTIYYGLDEPTGDLKKGDLWFRVVDGEYTRTYRYDGAVWQLIIDMDTSLAKQEAQQAKDDAQSAVDRANQATQQATNAINQAQTAFDEAQQALGIASNAMTQATSAFSLANDAFSEVESLSTLVDENTGEISTIKQSVIGLQTQVSDNAGNISSLTQIAQGLQTQVTDIEGNVTTLQQTAQGLQSSVTNLQDELDNLEIGGRNLIQRNLIEIRTPATVDLSRYTTEGYLTIATGESSYVGIRWTIPSVKPNKYYTLSYSYRKISGKLVSFGGHTDTTYSDNTVFVDGVERLGKRYASADSVFVGDDSDWHEVIVVFKTGNTIDPTHTVNIQPNRGNTDTVKVEIKDLVMVEGNKSMSWTPAPEDIDHQFSVITQTIDSITTRVGDAEGNITALQQTSSSLAARLTDAEGNITTLTTTVNGLQTTVSNVQGDVSSVTQLANALQVRMTNAEGDISTLTQTASSLQSTITEVRDNIGRWTKNYRVRTANPLNLTESDGSLLDDSYTYEVTAKVRGTSTQTTAVAIFKANSSGGSGGAGWTLEIIYEQGKTLNHPEFFIDENGRPSVRLYNHTSYYNVEVIHEKTIGRESVSTRTQSQITQLSDAINLRVEKDDVINQINISDESILIDGKRIHITGQTTIDNGVIKSANIQSLDAGKITSGTLDAGKISVINLSANSIVGGMLTSQNEATTFNLNTGDMDFSVNASIRFNGSAGGVRRIQNGRSAILSFPISAGSTTPMAALGVVAQTGVINVNDPSFRGIRIHGDNVSHTNDIIGDRWTFSRRVDQSQGSIVVSLDGSRKYIAPQYAASYNYDLGTGSNYFDRVYAQEATVNTGNYTIINNHNRTQGFRMMMGYQGENYLSFYGLNAGPGWITPRYYALGKSSNRFSQIFLLNQPNVSSDERLKKDIVDNTLGLAFIKQIETKMFRMNFDQPENLLKTGVIAQQVLSVLDNHGVNADDFSMVSKGDDGYYGVQYEQFIPTLIKSAQELDLKIESVKDDVEWLKLENQYLKQKIEQLEEMIA